MKRVVVAEPIHPDGLALLRARNDLEVTAFDTPAAPDALREALTDAHAVIVRTLPLGEDVLAGADALQIVSKHGVGCDNIATAHLAQRGVPVAIAAGANANGVAEHALCLLLACARNLFEQDAAARAGDWSFRQRTRSVELRGRAALVVGMGRIGQRVARLLDAFGMEVKGYDPHAAFEGAKADDLDAALSAADVVMVHVPLSDETAMLLGDGRLRRMKPGAILVNCARGGIVDEAALILALREGRIGWYGTDVFDREPMVADEPLLAAPNVIATAHTAAMTEEARRAMAMVSAQNVLDALDDRLRDDMLFRG